MGALRDTTKKLAPLMRLLASDQPGEVVAAAAGIGRVLRAAGYDMNDLVDDMVAATQPLEPCQPSHQAANKPNPANDAAPNDYWCAVLENLWERGQHKLGPRDLGFLENVWARAQAGAAPSAAQRKWLGDIEAKLNRTEARAS